MCLLEAGTKQTVAYSKNLNHRASVCLGFQHKEFSMRKGFTMIELIFVIVILGVLASVAIPRLAATRDDAEVAKAATNLTTAVSDITAYYTAKGSFASSVQNDFTKITNALDKSGSLKVKGTIECVKVTLPTTAQQQSSKVNLKLEFKEADAVCKQLAKLPGILTMCQIDANQQDAKASTCDIQIGGSGGIQF